MAKADGREVKSATNALRVELRKGRETMQLTRITFSMSALSALLVLLLLSPVARAQTTDDTLITPDGVGSAVLGMTVEEMTEALGDDYEVSEEVRITVDFNGHVVSRDGQVQFRAAKAPDSDQLTLFIVSNPEYQTEDGVGPTTSIVDAEDIYGEATLAWDPDTEGREFVDFEDGPGDTVAFRTPGIGGNNVGIYADGEFETTDYEANAVIAAVWLSCTAGEDCPGDAGAAPTPTEEPTEDEPEPTPTEEPEPEPEPTPTEEPEPTPTEEPTEEEPEATDDGDDAAAGELPKTGSNELIMISVVSALVLVGGALVLMERRFLCPAWLRR